MAMQGRHWAPPRSKGVNSPSRGVNGFLLEARVVIGYPHKAEGVNSPPRGVIGVQGRQQPLQGASLAPGHEQPSLGA